MASSPKNRPRRFRLAPGKKLTARVHAIADASAIKTVRRKAGTAAIPAISKPLSVSTNETKVLRYSRSRV